MSKSILVLALSSGSLLFGCSMGQSNSNGIPDVTVKVSPVTATLAVNAQQQFSATVTGSGNSAVNWSVGGQACLFGQDCGAISPTGLYTAPSSVPSPAQVTISASSQVNAFDSGSAQVIITASGMTVPALKGAYAFVLLGSDANGALSLAGKFVADGTGNLDSGEMNLCRGEHCDFTAFGGTYVEHAGGQGTIKPDISPRMVLHFTQNDSGKLKLDLEGEDNLRATGIMGLLTRSDQ